MKVPRADERPAPLALAGLRDQPVALISSSLSLAIESFIVKPTCSVARTVSSIRNRFSPPSKLSGFWIPPLPEKFNLKEPDILFTGVIAAIADPVTETLVPPHWNERNSSPDTG